VSVGSESTPANQPIWKRSLHILAHVKANIRRGTLKTISIPPSPLVAINFTGSRQ
jgi:hypothetical protein